MMIKAKTQNDLNVLIDLFSAKIREMPKDLQNEVKKHLIKLALALKTDSKS